jgi:hypothetical protein
MRSQPYALSVNDAGKYTNTIGSLLMTPDLDGLAVFPNHHKTTLAQSRSQRGLSSLSCISIC